MDIRRVEQRLDEEPGVRPALYVARGGSMPPRALELPERVAQ
jgi:hypothetical protein